MLARALVGQGWASIHLGMWDVGLAATSEAERLAEETAQARWAASAKVVRAILTGLRGDEQQAAALVTDAERIAGPTGANPVPSLIELARGITAATSGRHEHAYAHLHRVFDPADIAFHALLRGWFLFDFVDVAVQTHHKPEAERVLEDMRDIARRTGSPLLGIGVVCARPLLADGDEGDELFRAAMKADFTGWRYLRARLLLARGIWLRRQRRAADSRVPLRAAREEFDALGAITWGERARQELRASGEVSRHRMPSPATS